MKNFVDSSVFVATFYQGHIFHTPSLELFLRCTKDNACCGAHTLAEVYSFLTGAPGKDRVTREAALLFLSNVRSRFNLVTLTGNEYVDGVEWTASIGVIGGGIYDALLARCALKVQAEIIYTWNVKHFLRLGPEIAGRVATP